MQVAFGRVCRKTVPTEHRRETTQLIFLIFSDFFSLSFPNNASLPLVITKMESQPSLHEPVSSSKGWVTQPLQAKQKFAELCDFFILNSVTMC